MQIDDIRPKGIMDGARDAYLKDLNFYKSNVDKFQDRTCPVGCEVNLDLRFIQQDDFNFSRCQICFSIFMNPGPSENLVNEFYRISENYKYWAKYVYPTSKQKRKVLLSEPRAEYALGALALENQPPRKLRVLELGAGSGEVLEIIIEKILEIGFEVEAYIFEPNPDMEEFYENKPFNLIHGNFHEAVSELGRTEISFDLVCAFEVVEHLLNPRDYFQSISDLLHEGGIFVFSTPNALSAEVLVLREKSTTIDVEHISLLTPLSVFSMAAQCGFSVAEVETPGKLDLELMSDKNVLSRLIYFFFSKLWPRSLNKLRKLISESLLSSHSRYSLQKKSLDMLKL